MTELAPVEETTGHLSERMRYATALAASNLLPKAYQRQPANVLVAIEYGAALDLAPMVAIQSIHVIDGKPSASAQLISGLVRRAGHRLRVTGDDTHAVAEVVRSDDPDFVFRSEWNLDRAKTAGLVGKTVWKQYPAAMLKARAITEVARDACPEALAGVAYTPEELDGPVEVIETAVDFPTVPTVEPINDPDIEIEEDVLDSDLGEPGTPILATPTQLKTIGELLTICGVEDREKRTFFVGEMCGRFGATHADLTKSEASLVLEILTPLAESEDPVAALEGWL